MNYTIELPLPPKSCSPNRSGVWQRKARARANYRQECQMLYRERLWTPRQQADTMEQMGADGHYLCPAGVTISYEFFQARREFPDGRARFKDADNAIASMKAAQDALIDACIIPSDSADVVQLGGVKVHAPAKSGGRTCVVMTLETLEVSIAG
jgi:hypothetical protein